MAYTLEQLQQMGAKPIVSSPITPTPTTLAPTTGRIKTYTLDELNNLGAKPVETKTLTNHEKIQNIISSTQAVKGFNSYVNSAKEAQSAGIEQIKQGNQQFLDSKGNPVTALTGTVKSLAGVVNTASAPLAPLFAPLSSVINYTGDKVGNIKFLQNVANSPIGDFATHVADFVTDLMTVTGAVAVGEQIRQQVGVVPKPKFEGPTTPPPPTEPPPMKVPPKVQKVIDKRVEVLQKLDNQYAKLRKNAQYSPDDLASKQRIASTDVLSNAVDENGVIRTKQPGGAVQQYKDITLGNAEKVVRNALAREGGKTSLDEVGIRLEDAVNKSGLEGADLKVAINKIKQEIEGLKLRSDEQGYIPNEYLQDAKISTTNNIDYQTPPEISIYRKAIADGYRKLIVKNSSLKIDPVNQVLSKYLEDVGFLEKLDGKRVQGGKLGKYTAQITGNIVGGAAGGAVGGIPGVAVGTVVGGEIASRIKGNIMQKTFNGKVGNILPKSEVLDTMIKNNNSPRPMLPGPKQGAPKSSVPANGQPINVPSGGFKNQGVIDANYSRSLGNRNQSQSPAPIAIKNAIQNSIHNPIEKSIVGRVKEINAQNTQQLVKETLSGKREAYRLNNKKQLDAVKAYGVISPKATLGTIKKVYRAGTSDIKIGDLVSFTEKGALKYIVPGQNQIYSINAQLKDFVKSNGTGNEFIYAPTKSKYNSNNTSFSDVKNEVDLQATKDAVYKAFPFSAQAHNFIDQAKIGILVNNKADTLIGNAIAEGKTSPKGADFNNFIVKYIAPVSIKASDFILKHTQFLQNLDKANIDIKTTDPTILAHEMLHQVFENSPLSGKNGDGTPNINAEKFGNNFLDTWDKVAQTNQDSPMNMIDKHLSEDYDLQNMSGEEIASEKFAYLGELVGKYGVKVIPKELRPYYSQVFNFPKIK